MKNLVYYFTYGVSLNDWSNPGFKTFAEDYFNMLSSEMSKLYLITYDFKKDSINKFKFNNNVIIIYNKKKHPSYFFMLSTAVQLRNILKSKNTVVKFHQFHGIFPGIIAKILYGTKVIFRGGYIYSRNIFKYYGIFSKQYLLGKVDNLNLIASYRKHERICKNFFKLEGTERKLSI